MAGVWLSVSPWLSELFLRSQSDERLVSLVRSGHERAFAAIVERYGHALIAFVPMSALAHNHHRRHHHAFVHVRTFGEDQGQAISQSQDRNAGRVHSFANGVLTIELNDGSMVSGKVTKATTIECGGRESLRMHDDGDRGE